MPITEFLERNAKKWPNDVALVELNPDIKVPRLTTWKEFELIQPLHEVASRQEITWAVFNEKANRVANMLIARGIVKGDKVAILLMNCLDWLPIYFGILKTGAIAVPLNFRYSADEIEYCVKLASDRNSSAVLRRSQTTFPAEDCFCMTDPAALPSRRTSSLRPPTTPAQHPKWK